MPSIPTLSSSPSPFSFPRPVEIPSLLHAIARIAISVFALYYCGRITESLIHAVRNGSSQTLLTRPLLRWTIGGKIGVATGLLLSILRTFLRTSPTLPSSTTSLARFFPPSQPLSAPGKKRLNSAKDMEELIRMTADEVLQREGTSRYLYPSRLIKSPDILYSLIAYELLLQGTPVTPDGVEEASCRPYIKLNAENLGVADSETRAYTTSRGTREQHFATTDVFSGFSHFHQPTKPFTAYEKLKALTPEKREEVLTRLKDSRFSHNADVQEVVGLLQEIGQAMVRKGYLKMTSFTMTSNGERVHASHFPSFFSLFRQEFITAFQHILSVRGISGETLVAEHLDEIDAFLTQARETATLRILQKTSIYPRNAARNASWETTEFQIKDKKEGSHIVCSFTLEEHILDIYFQDEKKPLFVPTPLTDSDPFSPNCFTPDILRSLLWAVQDPASEADLESLVARHTVEKPEEREVEAQYAKITDPTQVETAKKNYKNLRHLAYILKERHEGAIQGDLEELKPISKFQQGLMLLSPEERRDQVRMNYFQPQYIEIFSDYSAIAGSCFYSAICKGLERAGVKGQTVRSLRSKAAAYIREHPEEFPEKMPGSLGLLSRDVFISGVETTDWATEHTILAMALSLNRPIHVIDFKNPCITSEGRLVPSEHEKYGPPASPSNPPLLLSIGGCHFSYIEPKATKTEIQ